MYNFEIVIRNRTDFEHRFPNLYAIHEVTVSGITLIKANEEGSEHPFPKIDKTYVVFWMGNFIKFQTQIEVDNVMLLKVKNFPRKPRLEKPNKWARNRVSLTKIKKHK